MNTELFFTKIVYNWLKTYNFTFSDDMVLKLLVIRLSDHREHLNWIAEYLRIMKDHEVSEEEVAAGTKSTFVSPCKILTQADVDNFAEKLLESEPRISEDFPRLPNTKVLAETLELNDVETLVFDFGCRLTQILSYDWRAFLEEFKYKEMPFPDLYSRLFGIQHGALVETQKSFLFQSGLLTQETNFKVFYKIHPDMSEAFNEPNLTTESLSNSLFPSNLNSELSTDLYPHVAKEIARTEKVISRGLEKGSKGINVMFWGLPGTGKTELALTLAKKNGWKLVVIGDINEANNVEKSRAQRLTSLKIALKLFGREKNTVLLFDEMEDLFKMDMNATFSKAFINRLVETTPIPIMWTTNNLENLGRAVLRRMIYNIGFETPPTSARRLIWQKYAKQYDVSMTEQALDEIAANFKTVPALIHNAVKIVAMAGVPSEELSDIVDSLNTLVNFGEKAKKEVTTRKDTPYDLSCVNADLDLVKLSDQLISAKPNYSLLLFGPAGTGKSEFGRHIAKQMGKKVLFKRASDLQSPYLGVCEKNIAAAFAEAAEEEMVLIIDEGDSFLNNREGAHRSYEVAQVNEMLSQMELHTQPFIMTTNLMKNIDPAAMRRFTFKLKLDFMKPEQSQRLFAKYFGVEAPASILKNDFLTPGDFANVMRKANILNITDAQEIYNLVLKECEVKPQFNARKIGF